MKTEAIRFRDKKDIQPLPPIPEEFESGMRLLIDETINGKGLSLFEKLEGVYAFLDRYNAFVSTFSVCQKGCAHCCRIDVNMSRLEAEYITFKGGPMLDQGSKFSVGHSTPCYFLTENSTCSIYALRPFNCRTFHTLDDPKYCVDGYEEHQTYGSAGKGYGVNIYSELARWLSELHMYRCLPYRNIRDWFPLL